MNKQTVCLNMIVKDEAPVIARCLASVRPFIDSWVIVDTGSTDGTQDLIRTLLADLPGELHERPWVDFGHNRTEAIELARDRGDYLLFIDADEALEIDDAFVMPELTADAYTVHVHYNGCSYLRKQLVRNSGIWRYEGVLHEYITTDRPYTEAFLNGVTNLPRHDGARARDPLTYRRDALLLEKALLAAPDNTRTVFYLAQSYRDANDFELALRHYQKRVEMGGWREEVWYSLYQVASMKQRLNKPWPEVLEAYLAAYQYGPTRAETLFRIGMAYQAKTEYHTAHLFLSRAMALAEPPRSALFVERPLYAYQIAVEFAVASYYVGDHKASIETNNTLLRGGMLPPQAVDAITRNRRFSVDALAGALPGEPEKPKMAPGRLRLAIVFRDSGPELDDCVESLLQQQWTDWEAVFIDDGSANDHSDRIPIEDPRVSLTRNTTTKGTDACVAEFLRSTDQADVIAMALTASERFADRAALWHIANAFTDPDCALVYGQYRTTDGVLGNAEPASCEEDFRARGAAMAAGGPAAFRAGSWLDTPFCNARFLDAPLTIRAPSREQQRGGLRAILTDATPMISCLMVTLDRLVLAKRSIRCFAEQTWPNRELVVITDGAPRYREALERYAAECGIAERVRFIDPGIGLPLGALRNISMAQARGEVVCQWDDDDGNHPDRLRAQYEDMMQRHARASFLKDHLQWIAEQRSLCWIDWTLGGGEGTAALFPGSLMMFNDPRFRYPEDGPHARLGEDSVLLEQLYRTVPVTGMSGAGHLYLYEYHGRNAFSREHHAHLTNFRTPAARIQANADRIRDAVIHYAIPRPVIVFGREGPVFAV